jgi:hypothetical protein
LKVRVINKFIRSDDLKLIGINLHIEQPNQSEDVDMLDPGNSSNQSQDVEMLNLEDDTQIDTVMTDLAQLESESNRIRIAEARLAAMEDGESEISKLNYIKEMDSSLKIL